MTGTNSLFRPGDLLLRGRRASDGVGLPPGQHEISSFPRYGTHMMRPDPATPELPVIEIVGCVAQPLTPETVRQLPRTNLVADFHCVAGWTTRDLAWDGVRFRDFCQTLPVPATATHIRLVGRDGFRAVLTRADALADDVLIADTLNGAPIPAEHGGPIRLVSASQYGYLSVKHLRRIEFHVGEPSHAHRRRTVGTMFLQALGMHPRARVALEERHRHLPAWSVRAIYRNVIHPIPYVLGYLGHRSRTAANQQVSP